MCLSIGRRKANVFPLPVLAIPIKSRPGGKKKMLCPLNAQGSIKGCNISPPSFIVQRDFKVEKL
jgi:hypothetical protein